MEKLMFYGEINRNRFNGTYIHIDSNEDLSIVRPMYLQILKDIKEAGLGEYRIICAIKPEDNIMIDGWTIILEEVK